MTGEVKRVVFLCTGNSCRSQMAEGLLRHLGGEGFVSQSAGTFPSGVHPLSVKVMGETGIDISSHYSKGLAEVELATADCVITLCCDADEKCPALPEGATREHWPTTDPVSVPGNETILLGVFREVRDELGNRVEDLIRRLTDE